MAKRGFRVPFVSNIPVELQNEIEKRGEEDTNYLALKNKNTLKKFMNPSSNLRKVADYLSDYFKTNFMETLSYKKIADELGLSEPVVTGCISELAGWDKYPLVIVKTPKQKGKFQLHSKNLEDTESWITMQQRHIASREQRLVKTVNATFIKRKSRRKEKIKNKIKIKEVK